MEVSDNFIPVVVNWWKASKINLKFDSVSLWVDVHVDDHFLESFSLFVDRLEMEVHLLFVDSSFVEHAVVKRMIKPFDWSEDVVSRILITAIILDEGWPISHAEIEGLLLASISIVHLKLDLARCLGGTNKGNAEFSDTDLITGYKILALGFYVGIIILNKLE